MIRARTRKCQEAWGILAAAMATIGISLPRLKSHIETLSSYRPQPGRPGHHPLVLEPAPRGSAEVAARADDRGRARDAGGRGGQHVRLPPRRGRGRADRLPHRHGAGGRPARRRPGRAGRARVPADHQGGRARHAPAARGGGLERRGGPLRQPLRLARLHRQARRGRGPASSRRWTGSGSWTRWPGPGTTPSRVAEARCDPRTLHAYVELHIEQGPHLEAARLPIGLVEGIVGIRRNRLTFVGEPDHAGTTPMAWRKDAFLAACEYALKAREHIVRKGSGRSVTNFGRIELVPGRLQHRARAGGAAAGDARAGPEDPGPARPRVRGARPHHHAPTRPEGDRRGHVPRPSPRAAPRGS